MDVEVIRAQFIKEVNEFCDEQIRNNKEDVEFYPIDQDLEQWDVQFAEWVGLGRERQHEEAEVIRRGNKARGTGSDHDS